MTTQGDCSISLKEESTYGTAVVVDRSLEFLTESLDFKPEFLQGEGLRVGSVLPRSARRSIGKVVCDGDIEIEAVSRGMGLLLKAALGAVTTQTITGGACHSYTPTNTDPLPSLTIQKGLPLVGGGAIQATTFKGAVCSGFELSAGNGEIVKLKTSWIAQDMATNIAYVPAVYPATANLYTFVQGGIGIGGVISGGGNAPFTTPAITMNVVDFSLSWDNGIDEDGFNLGGAGRRSRKNVLGPRKGTGKLTVEYDSNVMREAFLQQSRLTLLLTFQTSTAVGSIPETLQVCIPMLALDGELPKANGGKVITQSVPFTILDDGTAAPDLTILMITADVLP